MKPPRAYLVLVVRCSAWLLSFCWLAAVSQFTVQASASQTLHRITSTLLAWDIPDTLSGSHTNPFPQWVSLGKPALKIPPPTSFSFRVDGQSITVSNVTLIRQATHADSQKYRIEVLTRILIELTSPIPEVASAELSHPEVGSVSARLTEDMESPVFLVNRVGYLPNAPKRGFLYLHLGDWEDLEIPEGLTFDVIDSNSGVSQLKGVLHRRSDIGFNDSPAPYQRVWEADFSGLTTPGSYRLKVSELGTSPAFVINDGVAGQAVRSAALGLYHQRSGVALTLPYTRFTRAAGHLSVAEVPDSTHPTNPLLAASTANFHKNPRHIAPQLSNVTASLYPILRQGPVDVSGGHHDAGDYSKYTINSAQLIHELAFAAEHFPGVGGLDSLGLPESHDDIGDLWQIAKREADFLTKLQDLDGGFYFLVYPRARRYENNVLPSQGDPQVVWPKNTAATAAACAALAQLAAAPEFQRHFPLEAARYRIAATNAWGFLQKAMLRYGRDGAYQKLTHYGDEFLHDDEMAWAAASLFMATGAPQYQSAVQSWMPNPSARENRRWTWWRLPGAWGNAIRTYAFGGTRSAAQHRDTRYLDACRRELLAAGVDQAVRSEQCALGLSFPVESKRIHSAGWIFPQAVAFDLLVADLQSTDPNQKARFESALWSNLGYAWGANPAGVTFVTGLGPHFPREPVSQIARNDPQKLPPSGLVVGACASGFSWLDHYKRTLPGLMYPSPNRDSGRFPLFDRYTDVFNTTTEATVIELGQSLAVGAALFAKSSGAIELPAELPALTIAGIPDPLPLGSTANVCLSTTGLFLDKARILWETPEGWSEGGLTRTITRSNTEPSWIEVEIVLPDGRRLFGTREIERLETPQKIHSRISGILPQAVVRAEDPNPINHSPPSQRLRNIREQTSTNHAPATTANSVSTASIRTPPQACWAPPIGNPLCWLPLDGSLADIGSPGSRLNLKGHCAFRPVEGIDRSVLHFGGLGSQAWLDLPTTIPISSPIRISAWILPESWTAAGDESVPLLSLAKAWDARLELTQEKGANSPDVLVGSTPVANRALVAMALTVELWHQLELKLTPQDDDAAAFATVTIDGGRIAEGIVPFNHRRTGPWRLNLGNFRGCIAGIEIHAITPDSLFSNAIAQQSTTRSRSTTKPSQSF